MKKLLDDLGKPIPRLKFDLKMKLSVFFLFTTFFALQANTGYAQKTKVTLDMQNVTVERLLDEIENRTEFLFVYKSNDVDLSRLVSVNVKKERVTTLLEHVFKNSQTTFNVINKQIFLTEKNASKLPKEEASLSQDPIRVTGKVTDENGAPIPGVTVRIAGTNRGVATDFDGNYSVAVSNGQVVLEFSSIGLATQEIMVGNQTMINVTMQEAVSQLDEVVLNAGYYKTTKREATGNIAKVSARELGIQPIATPLEGIAGRMAGVTTRQFSGMPGAGIDIQIRGRNSLRTDGNLPLYVIDGVPIPSTSLLGAVGGETFRSTVAPINNINPSDIESIEILKDADATSIYGSRGSNGVVLITTKKGKSGKTTIQVNQSAGFSRVSKKLDLLNSDQYLEMRVEAITNDGFASFLEDPSFDGFFPDIKIWDTSRNTDWQEELIGGSAEFQNSDISFSGGNDKTKFLVSGSYFRQTTVFPGDFDLKRLSGLLNLTHTSTNGKFNTSVSANFLSEKNNLPLADFTGDAINLSPNAPEPFDDEGNLNFEDNTFNDNPYVEIFRKYEARKRSFFGNASLAYEVIPGLSLKSNLGYNYLTLNETGLTPIKSQNPANNPTGSFIRGTAFSETWSIEPQIEYIRYLGKGKLTLLAGATLQSTIISKEEIIGAGYTSDNLLGNINAAPILIPGGIDFSEYNYNAFFTRINYNFKNRYIINLTGRRDGSSRFGPGKQFGNFGAFGLAWLFSNEKLFKDNLSFLSFGKLRGSYGTTGSDQIGNYQFLATYTTTTNPYLGTPGLVPSRLPNQDFAWETNKKLEFGLDIGFFNNRFLLSSSYYRNRSSNQLIGIPLAATAGFQNVQANFPAEVKNTGLEFELTTSNFRTDSFKWTTSANLSIPRNKLLSFPNIESSAFANRFTVGESLFNTQGFVFNGVDPETGLYTFEDQNGDGNLTREEDFRAVKEISQDYFGGINNNISFKGIQLDFLFQFVKQTGTDYLSSFPLPGGQSNQPVQVLERWQEPGDITNVQQFSSFNIDAFTAQGNRDSRSNGNITNDVSFIRLKNASLSYNFTENLLKYLRFVDNLRIYVQGQNLWTITDFMGYDPETQFSDRLPPLRTITAGINIEF